MQVVTRGHGVLSKLVRACKNILILPLQTLAPNPTPAQHDGECWEQSLKLMSSGTNGDVLRHFWGERVKLAFRRYEPNTGFPVGI